MIRACLLIALVGASSVQAQNNTPISAIEWLSQPSLAPIAKEKVTAPEDNPEKIPAKIIISNLKTNNDKKYGLIPQEISGIPENFWTEIDSDTLHQLLMNQPRSNLPSADDLLIRALLATTAGDTNVLLVRVETLVDRGAVQAAYSLIKQAQIENIQSFELFAKTALLTNNVEEMCVRLNGARHLSNNEALRVYCQLHSGSRTIARINFSALKALGEFGPITPTLLAASLNKENKKNFTLPEVNLPTMTPLDFHLWNNIGQTVPTKNLPISFATLGLKKSSTWLEKIQATERLSITGSLPADILLQTYNSGEVATSGGDWDRVLAVQALNRVLSDPIIDPSNELNYFWETQQDKKLIATLSRAWSDRLLEFSTTNIDNDQLFQMQVLSRQNAFPFKMTMKRLQNKHQLLSPKVFKEVMSMFDKEIFVSKEFRAINILKAMRFISKALNGDRLALSKAILLYREMGLNPLAQQLAMEFMIIGNLNDS